MFITQAPNGSFFAIFAKDAKKRSVLEQSGT